MVRTKKKVKAKTKVKQTRSKSAPAKKATAKKASSRKRLFKKATPTKGRVTVKTLLESSADYNPRTITERELKGLKGSYETYGDLSGVVLNTATGTLVSGHQRLKTLHGKKTKVVKERHKDPFGTVAVGHIEVESDGGTYKIPYREVNWSDRKAEAAANIAANAGGGQFDNDKLGKLLEELDLEDQFTVETIGLDPLTIRQLTTKDSTKGSSSSTQTGNKSSGSDSFREFDSEDMDLEHECPRCKFRF